MQYNKSLLLLISATLSTTVAAVYQPLPVFATKDVSSVVQNPLLNHTPLQNPTPDPLCPSFGNLNFTYVGPFPTSVNLPTSDPLELYGGLDAVLSHEENYQRTMRTDFTDNGELYIEKTKSSSNGKVVLSSRNLVDWSGLGSNVGRGVRSSFEMYAVATFNVPRDGHFQVACINLRNFWIDEQWFQGDSYASGDWWGDSSWLKWPVHLSAGLHKLRVKTRGSFRCQIQCKSTSPLLYTLSASTPSDFNARLADRVPDIVDHEIASPYVSFPVVNAHNTSATIPGSIVVEVTDARVNFKEDEESSSKELSHEINASDFKIEVLSSNNAPTANATAGSGAWGLEERSYVKESKLLDIRILPGQAYPLPLYLTHDSSENVLCKDAGASEVVLSVRVTASFEEDLVSSTTRDITLRCKSIFYRKDIVVRDHDAAYTFTFIDADGSVQYGAAVPPAMPCATSGKACNVLLSSHGARVDASSPAWTQSFDRQTSTWLVFPTNRGNFGYDWQGVGRRNGIETLHAFAQTLPGVPTLLKELYKANANRVLFSGHSMGGHGCLIMATSYPDAALGAACAAAWIRHDHYISSFQRIGTNFADPTLLSVIESAMAEYHPDTQAVNLKGIPFLGRMGGRDTTVHPWNLRRFVRVLESVNEERTDGMLPESRVATLSEEEGEGHWFGSVMRGTDMERFYEDRYNASYKPDVPSTFRIRAFNLWGTGRAGIRVLQSFAPFSAAWIDVSNAGSESNVWRLRTQNVKRLQIENAVPNLLLPEFRLITLMNSDDTVSGMFSVSLNNPSLCIVRNEKLKLWDYCKGTWQESERSVLNSGPTRQVFGGAVTIVYGTNYTTGSVLKQEAVKINNVALARGHNGMAIYSDEEVKRDPSLVSRTNVILLGGPRVNVWANELIEKSTIALSSSFSETSSFQIGPHVFNKPSTGTIVFGSFDLSGSRKFTNQLVVMIAGTDDAGLSLAIPLVPMSSNVEIPDMMVVGKSFAWQGAGGILATGFWGNNWEYLPEMSYPKHV